MRFIIAQSEYDTVLTLVSTAVDIHARLPDRVFRRAPVRCVCIEFDFLLDPGFWPAVRELARHYGDTQVACLIVDPDATTFFRRFGYFGALLLDSSDPVDRYIQAVDYEPAPSWVSGIKYSTLTMAFAVESRGFAIWGNRDMETAVIALYDLPQCTMPDVPDAFPSVPASEAIEMMRPAFRNDAVPTDFRDRFLANYQCG